MTCAPYKFRIYSFLAPKQGSEPLECEDAIAFNAQRMLFAIADGATEAYDSRTWARLLVKAWVRVDPPAIESKDLEPLVRDLGRWLHGRWSKRKLPWYAEEKSQGGSFAALLTLRFEPLENGVLVWKANALGDCCLVHRNGSTVLDKFPITRSDEFGSNPVLLPSIESKQHESISCLRQISGTSGSGRDFMLLSDAVACWFFKQHETENLEVIKTFDKLVEANNTENLMTFFNDLRKSHQIRNDDIAILRLQIH